MRNSARRNGMILGLVAGFMLAPVTFGQRFVEQDVQVIVPQTEGRMRHYADPIRVVSVGVDVVIMDQIVRTTMTLELTNSSKSQAEASLLLPIPDGAAVTGMHFDGLGDEPVFRVLNAGDARREYEAIVSKMKDPALLEFVGTGAIRTSAFPIAPGATQHLSITFELVAASHGGRSSYTLPRSQVMVGNTTPWTIQGSVRTTQPLTGLFCPSHEITLVPGEGGLATQFKAVIDSDSDSGSFRLVWFTQSQNAGPVSATTLLYPSPEAHNKLATGFFMTMLNLNADKIDLLAATPKREIIIVLDRSGSMNGTKFVQAKAAALSVIQSLNDGEAFNIIDYSDTIASFNKNAVIKSDKTMNQARDYLARLRVGGGTNIHDALLAALRPEPGGQELMPMVFFLTDGLPTVGQTDEVGIREAVANANTHHRRIFSFGVGHDVNAPLLTNLSRRGKGSTTFIDPSENVETRIAEVFDQLGGISLTDLVMTMVDDAGQEIPGVLSVVVPATLPDLFLGDQVVVLGRYAMAMPAAIRITGSLLGEEVTVDVPVDPGEASLEYASIPRLWANRRIGFLIDSIRQQAADGRTVQSDPALKELVDEIVSLSTQYGILTEYTSFLATEDADFSTAAGRQASLDDAEERIQDRAVRGRSGKGGVMQEQEIQSMGKSRAPGMAYRDASGKKVQVKNILQIADRTLFLRGKRWVDSRLLEKENEKPDQTILPGTSEYATLLDKLTKEGRQGLLAQRGEIYLLIDSQRVLVQNPE